HGGPEQPDAVRTVVHGVRAVRVHALSARQLLHEARRGTRPDRRVAVRPRTRLRRGLDAACIPGAERAGRRTRTRGERHDRRGGGRLHRGDLSRDLPSRRLFLATVRNCRMRTDATLVTSPKLAHRIGFGALALRPSGSGVQTYVRELLTALDPLLPSAALRATVQCDATGELPPRVTPSVRPVADGVRRMLYAKVPVRGVDLFHSLDVDLPVLCSGVTVSTFHDLAVFDTPWAFSRHRAAGERALLRDAMRRADVLVAVSNFTAERLLALCGREAVVTPLAPAVWAKPPAPEEMRDIRRAYRL